MDELLPGGAGDHDLVAAVAHALRRFRQSPGAVAEAARAQGVAVECLEAAVLASVVADWLATLPGPAPAACESTDAEATRAAVAALAGRPVTLALRVPPLLAIRLVELAGATATTPERAAVQLLAAAADPAYTAACRRNRRPDPRPWNGSQS